MFCFTFILSAFLCAGSVRVPVLPLDASYEATTGLLAGFNQWTSNPSTVLRAAPGNLASTTEWESNLLVAVGLPDDIRHDVMHTLVFPQLATTVGSGCSVTVNGVSARALSDGSRPFPYRSNAVELFNLGNAIASSTADPLPVGSAGITNLTAAASFSRSFVISANKRANGTVEQRAAFFAELFPGITVSDPSNLPVPFLFLPHAAHNVALFVSYQYAYRNRAAACRFIGVNGRVRLIRSAVAEGAAPLRNLIPRIMEMDKVPTTSPSSILGRPAATSTPQSTCPAAVAASALGAQTTGTLPGGGAVADFATLFAGSAAVPNGQDVTLVAGTTYLFTQRSVTRLGASVLGHITIPATATLLFGNDGTVASPLTLRMNSMQVSGSVRAGGPGCPMGVDERAEIVFYGTRPANALTAMNDLNTWNEGRIGKTLEVMSGGLLAIHGARVRVPWTHIAVSTQTGDNDIIVHGSLSDLTSSGWVAGAKIILTTSADRDIFDDQHEELIIESVSALPSITSATIAPYRPFGTGSILGGSTTPVTVCRIRVVGGVRHYHHADGDHAVEVGLLTGRSFTFRSDETDARVDVARDFPSTRDGVAVYTFKNVSDHYGGHIMVRNNAVRVVVEGVRFYLMGQRNLRARYPIHWHGAGDRSATNDPLYGGGGAGGGGGDHVFACVFEKSLYRSIVIHATSGIRLERNVIYDGYAHQIYFEDGIEQNSTVAWNLGVRPRCVGECSRGNGQGGATHNTDADSTQPADRAPAPYYFTNAFNVIAFNVAVGGWTGFSFPGLDAPIGMSRTMAVEPKAADTDIFYGNTARSSGFLWDSGAAIYMGGRLWLPDPTGAPTQLRYLTGRYARKGYALFNTTRIRDGLTGFQHWGSDRDIVLDRLLILGAERGTTLFGTATVYKTTFLRLDTQNLAVSQNMRLFAQPMSPTPDYLVNDRTPTPRQGFQTYDTWTRTLLEDVVFEGYAHTKPWNKTGSNIDFDLNTVAWTTLVHSDQFKPQYMTMTCNVQYRDSDRAAWFGHRASDTGSYWMWTIDNPDGSAVGTTTPTLLTADVPWWAIDSSVKSPHPDWAVYALSMEHPAAVGYVFNASVVPGRAAQYTYNNTRALPGRPIEAVRGPVTALFNFVGGFTEVDSEVRRLQGLCERGWSASPDCLFGTIHHWGYPERSMPFSKLTITTGPASVGWYLRWPQAARVTSIDLFAFARGATQPLALTYPSSATGVTIRRFYRWNNQLNENLVAGTSREDVLADFSGRTFFFDSATKTVYLKLVNQRQRSLTDDVWKLPYLGTKCGMAGQHFSYQYEITATCTSGDNVWCDGSPTFIDLPPIDLPAPVVNNSCNCISQYLARNPAARPANVRLITGSYRFLPGWNCAPVQSGLITPDHPCQCACS